MGCPAVPHESTAKVVSAQPHSVEHILIRNCSHIAKTTNQHRHYNYNAQPPGRFPDFPGHRLASLAVTVRGMHQKLSPRQCRWEQHMTRNPTASKNPILQSASADALLVHPGLGFVANQANPLANSMKSWSHLAKPLCSNSPYLTNHRCKERLSRAAAGEGCWAQHCGLSGLDDSFQPHSAFPLHFPPSCRWNSPSLPPTT